MADNKQKNKKAKEKVEKAKPDVVLPKYVRAPDERSRKISKVRILDPMNPNPLIPWHAPLPENPNKNVPANVEDINDINEAAWNIHNASDVKGYDFNDNSVKLTKGTMNTGQVNREILTDLIAAADKTGIPRNTLLAIAGQESMFGEARGRRDQQEIVSGWDVSHQYEPVGSEEFFAKKGVPNIQGYASKKGYRSIGNENYEKSLDSALNIHPEWIQQYRKAQNNVKPRGEVNYFEEIANMAIKDGIGRINPGDPDYPNKIKRMEGYVSGDPAIQTLYKEYDKSNKKKMPDGGKINNMPDPTKKVVTPISDYEKARIARLQELSKQWGVPTSAIYSQSRKGPKSYGVDDQGNQRQVGEGYQSYFTFDPQGNIAQSTRDYNNPVGMSQYTPADIALQQQNPGKGLTVAGVQAAQDTTKRPVKPPTLAANMKKGGKVRKYNSGGKAEGYGILDIDTQTPPMGYQYAYDGTLMPISMMEYGGQAPYNAIPVQGPFPYQTFGNQSGYGQLPPPKVYNYGGQMPSQWPQAQMGYDLEKLPIKQPVNIAQPSDALEGTPQSIGYKPVDQGAPASQGGGGGGFNAGANVNLNLAGPILGLAAISNQMNQRNVAAKQSATDLRKGIQQGQEYNPFKYGTGSTMLYEQGGQIPRGGRAPKVKPNKAFSANPIPANYMMNGWQTFENGGSVDPVSQALSVLRQHGYDIEMG